MHTHMRLRNLFAVRFYSIADSTHAARAVLCYDAMKHVYGKSSEIKTFEGRHFKDFHSENLYRTVLRTADEGKVMNLKRKGSNPVSVGWKRCDLLLAKRS